MYFSGPLAETLERVQKLYKQTEKMEFCDESDDLIGRAQTVLIL